LSIAKKLELMLVLVLVLVLLPLCVPNNYTFLAQE